MPNGKLSVTKTLVIGLGSTGTEVCDMLAERIQWELGDASKSPWVSMLCIETDTNKQTSLRDLNDFLTIEIPPTEFKEMVDHPERYDEKIHLSQWVDTKTLRELPDKSVGSGAGNIRMVGRLAFLYQQNYSKVLAAVSERLNELRELSGSVAMERLGVMPDGSSPEVDFGDGSIKIIVAGTLCGGTCSGLASDFGYFLKTLCNAEDKRVAIFTLPHPDLSTATVSNADRYKRNAYHALLELNYYHLSDRGQTPRIKFWDGKESSDGEFPWDIPYLAIPKGITLDQVQELNRAIADRIFLNVFVPETHPDARLVDATFFDRDNRAHVFCSFGLSTVEFPAQQVMEACSKRLMSFALKEWQGRSLQDTDYEGRLAEMGLTWDRLTEALLATDSGDNIGKVLDRKLKEVIALAATNVEVSERSLSELRDAFSVRAGTSANNTELMAGIVPKTVQGNRQAAAEAVIVNLRTTVRTRLLRYEEGPSPLRQVLRRANDRLLELRSVTMPEYEQDRQRVDAVLSRIRSYQQSILLGVFGLKGSAIRRTIPQLREALESEVKQRVQLETWKAFQTVRNGDNIQTSGVIDRIMKIMTPVDKRLDNLSNRLRTLVNRFDERHNALAKNTPVVNGLCIFEPEVVPGTGTVAEEYDKCLRQEDETESLEIMRRKYAVDIIGAWSGLPDAIVPERNPDHDWLMEDFYPNSELPVIPSGDLRRMEYAARKPFQSLGNVDVLSRWQKMDGALIQAKSVAQDARPFLEVSRAVAEQGGRSPVITRCAILSPRSPYKEKFDSAARAGFSASPMEMQCPDSFRAVMLEEWYRFPLSGALTVLGHNGLCTAECYDFPTFFTRKDVPWVGIAEEEVQKTREAEELVSVLILTKSIEPKGGALLMKWSPRYMGDHEYRRLPLDFKSAVTMIAMENQDIDGNDLQGAMQAARDQVEYAKRNCDADNKEQDKAFVRLLNDHLLNGAAAGIPNWNIRSVGQQITKFCARDEGLYSAYLDIYPPNRAKIESLRKAVGDSKPGGGTYQEPGLYCTCGGFIGRDEQEAALNGWRCYINPEHVYG